jgi:FkbM family methyltransferase
MRWWLALRPFRGRNRLFFDARAVLPKPHRPVVSTTELGFRMSLHLSDEIDAEIFLFGVYDPVTTAVLSDLLRNASLFVDVGANIGFFSLLAQCVMPPDGQVLAFEPNPRTRERLERNLLLNGAGNVVVRAVALGEVAGAAEVVQESASRSGDSYVAGVGAGAPGGDRSAVEVQTLDAHLLDDPRGPVVIKIDVEGLEARVLRGGIAAITRLHPVVLLEVNARALSRAGDSAEDVVRLLEPLGYQPFVVEGGVLAASSWSAAARLLNANVLAAIPAIHSQALERMAGPVAVAAKRFVAEVHPHRPSEDATA